MPSLDEGVPRAKGSIKSNGVSAAGRARVAEIQRARLVAAMVEVAAERGFVDATVARVVARAGVSRRTFYELFEDREDCFLAGLDEGIAQASRYVLDAYNPEAKWAERLRIALASLLSFLTYERGVGRLLIVGSLGAGAPALERRRRVLAQIITLIDEGRMEMKTGALPPPLTAEGIVGGALSIVHARLVQGDRRLDALVNPLMSMIVLPYLGPAAARRELARPVPKVRARVARAAEDPLRDLDMRLTYRTVRVLLSVGALGDGGSYPSNRQVGEAAEISDQGQISKLLGRLERLGLVHNNGLAPGKGAPNAWALTEKGAHVEQAMRVDGDHRPARAQPQHSTR
jgi:AcrR family transcriptional regulator